MTTKAYALIDCNSFYCSCERLFRPELNNKPVIVLSNNDGCAIARTNEAKALGIKMGEPYYKIKQLCKKHRVEVFSCNFALYTNISNRVMQIIISNCPDVEVYSVDEAFADLTGVEDILSHGKMLREKILQDVGIPTGVGIAPTKVLSKVANHIAKKSNKAKGVVYLDSEYLQNIALKRTPVGDIWGVGRASSKKLNDMRIYSAYEFKTYKNDKLIQKIFTKVGLQIKQELQGINCFALSQDVEKKKEIMCSRTFGDYVFDKNILKEAVSNYIENAAAKMRQQKSVCNEVSVFARTNPFKENIEQYYMYERSKLANPTCDTRTLLAEAFRLLERGYREGYEYRKAGIKLSNFNESSNFQMNFFYESDSEKDLKLMSAIDYINRVEGEGVLKFASSGTSDDAWKMNRNFKSPRYTTSWSELPSF
ncbi:MAG: Y-family DNA polymerase [Halobacteriovoraceae bacterium]|jgi:DNA polymerase V|nr:Y-family DNA polymerase [Halobacteriovoraceae bacterium]